MNAGLSKFRLLLMFVVIGSLAVGCSNVEERAGADDNSAASIPKQTQQGKKDNGSVDKKDLSISSPAPAPAPAKTDAVKAPNYNVAEPFDITKPTLMGFSTGDSVDAVVARFGKPAKESTMLDGARTLQILEYPGFMFGAVENKSIIFIEVMSDQINPGLNQFRIGQTVDEAQKALGPADSLNDFVMIYEVDGIIMKCDLDPGTRQVLSIKLFAE